MSKTKFLIGYYDSNSCYKCTMAYGWRDLIYKRLTLLVTGQLYESTEPFFN